MPRPLLDYVKSGRSFAASASRGPLRAAKAVAFGNPHFPSLYVFGYVGAEQKEGWFYVTDNKQPKIKIKILGNGERGSPRSSP